jgi:Bacterial transglutaminase-like cysteine proteinase BTLCP
MRQVVRNLRVVRRRFPADANVTSVTLGAHRTSSGIGHLVLVVATTNGDIVMDNLTEALRPWQTTDYQWIKIQSASDSRFWNEINRPAPVQHRRQVASCTSQAGWLIELFAKSVAEIGSSILVSCRGFRLTARPS